MPADIKAQLKAAAVDTVARVHVLRAGGQYNNHIASIRVGPLMGVISIDLPQAN